MHLIVHNFVKSSPSPPPFYQSDSSSTVATAGRCHPTTQQSHTNQQPIYASQNTKNKTKIAFCARFDLLVCNDRAVVTMMCVATRLYTAAEAAEKESAFELYSWRWCDGSRETGATYVDDISINSYFTSTHSHTHTLAWLRPTTINNFQTRRCFEGRGDMCARCTNVVRMHHVFRCFGA